jgi:DNA-binding NarL/FixJ family response regulator
VTPAVRVVLADDHTLVRAGVRKILESQPGIAVVGEVSDGAAALEALETLHPDVLVLDLTMPGMDGFEVLSRARDLKPDLRILVLTMHASPEYVARAVESGADGYLLKDSAVVDLVAGLEAVMAGRPYYSASVGEKLGEIVRNRAEARRLLDELTDREREVLKLVAQGSSTKEIAARFDISARTVETHRANLMRKLGIKSVARLTQFAIKEGLVEGE